MIQLLISMTLLSVFAVQVIEAIHAAASETNRELWNVAVFLRRFLKWRKKWLRGDIIMIPFQMVEMAEVKRNG